MTGRYVDPIPGVRWQVERISSLPFTRRYRRRPWERKAEARNRRARIRRHAELGQVYVFVNGRLYWRSHGRMKPVLFKKVVKMPVHISEEVLKSVLARCKPEEGALAKYRGEIAPGQDNDAGSPV